MTWTNGVIYRQDYFLTNYGLPSGLDHGVISPSYAMANLREGYLIVGSPVLFDFYGAAFTSLGKNNARITVEGYRPGDPLGSVSQAGVPTFESTAMFSAGAPTDLSVDFTDIVALKVLAYRWDDLGTTTNAYPAYGTYGNFFVMDNMAVSVPEPSSLVLALMRSGCSCAAGRSSQAACRPMTIDSELPLRFWRLIR